MTRTIKQLSAWLLALAMVFAFLPALEDSYADAEIPEGAPFTKVVTNAEGIEAVVTATEEKASYGGGEATIYKITVPMEVTQISITVNRADVYFNPTYGTTLSGCTNRGNGMCSFVNSDYDDDTVTFHINPATYTTEEGYWAAPYKASAFQPLFGFTVEQTCDHPEEELTYTEGQEATCTEDGKHETWYCAKCGRYYTDEALTTRIKSEDVLIPAFGHDFGEDGLCTTCGLRGDTTVEFVGDGADKVTEKSADTENAGLDYKFKAGNGIASERIDEETEKIALNPATAFNGKTPYKFGTIEYNGVTVPNYEFHTTSNGMKYAVNQNDANYDLIWPDGSKAPKNSSANRRFKEGQNFIVRVDTEEPVIGVFLYQDNDKKYHYTPLTIDDEEFWTIPAGRMKAGTTVTINIDKPEYEKVEDQINAIGEVTLEKEEAIAAARAAYEALSDADKEKVDPSVLLKLTNAEQELALLKARTDENAELIDAQLAAIRQNQAAIDALNEQLQALEDASAADKAALEAQIAELQKANAELAAAVATKEELDAKVAELNQQIADLQTALNEVSGEVAGKDALDKSKTAASKELTQYLEDNLDGMYPADQTKAEIAALKAIIKIKDAEAQAEIDTLLSDAKAAIDEKVEFKTVTEAAIAEAKAFKVTGLNAKAKAKKFTVTWKKTAGATGYQVQYKLKTAKKWSALKNAVTKTKAVSKKLKKGKIYSFRVRTYTKINGKKVFGVWSKTKNAKCK